MTQTQDNVGFLDELKRRAEAAKASQSTDVTAWARNTALADIDLGRLRFELVNLDGFETVTVEFPAVEIGSARLDELARWLLGEPNGFLENAQNLRRVEA